MSIKLEVLNALRWSAFGRLAGQLVSWAITVYVIRILSPSDYGLIGMASILIGFATLFNELGVIPALIQSRYLDESLIRQLFGFVITSTILIFCLLFLTAPLLSRFFDEPRLTPITQALAITMLIGAVSAVPNALLERDLQFRGISLVEFLSMILGSATTLLLAIAGSGVWSLVIGNVVSTTIKTVGILIISKFYFLPTFGLRGLRPLFVFGANITGQRVLWYVNSSVDVLLVGKLLGEQALGIYSVAFQLSTLPVSKMFGIVNRVAFPAYARIQDDNRQAADYFITTVRLAWLVFCPCFGECPACRANSSRFLWGAIGRMLSSLALVPLIVPFRVISLLMAPLTDGLGRPDIGLRNLLTFTLLVPLAILIGTSWGLIGVCIGLIIASIVALAINIRRSLVLLRLRPTMLLQAVTPTAIAGAVMYGAVWLVKSSMIPDAPAPWRLCAAIITGVSMYVVATLLINRTAVRQCLSLVRGQV